MNESTLIVIAHSGLDKRITEKECLEATNSKTFKMVHFIDLDICNVKLSDLYNLPFEQLALEQHRRFKSDIEPILLQYPDAVISYFGLAPIPLAFQLGVLLNNYSKYWIYQFHHERKIWYKNTEPIKNYEFELTDTDLPKKVEKGKGDVFIRIGTSYRIEPQHTHEVISNPTNEFELSLKNPHIDSISNEEELGSVVRRFQEILSAYSNFLPDKDKIHLFIASTTGVSFALGTKVNPNVCPFIQTYQFSRDENPKYAEAILISKKTETLNLITEEQKFKAAEIRNLWNKELQDKLKAFISTVTTGSENWFKELVKNDNSLILQLTGAWQTLPDLSKTSLSNDSIDLDVCTVNGGFKYDGIELKWQIDDGMFVSLDKRFKRHPNANIVRAGRLFLFHEGLHYCQEGHCLTAEIASGIGRFPKVIEEADYQADVWALLYEYKYSSIYHSPEMSINLKKFFLDSIDTAVETMWSFVDNGSELSEIQVRSMNRFLNWYWQWVRIEKLSGHGTLEEIVKILFDKPTIEFAGAEIITLDKLRTCFKLNSKYNNNYELAIFHKNKVSRFTPTGMIRIVEGFRELNGKKIKEGLRSFFVSL